MMGGRGGGRGREIFRLHEFFFFSPLVQEFFFSGETLCTNFFFRQISLCSQRNLDSLSILRVINYSTLTADQRIRATF